MGFRINRYVDLPRIEFIPFLETLTDAVSIHNLKQKFPDFVSLIDYFRRVYGPEDSPEFKLAQRNFIESVAAYSVVTYLLQIKDRLPYQK